MPTYEITSISTGQSLGEYEADDAADAIRAMWDDAQAAEEDRDWDDLRVFAVRPAREVFDLEVLETLPGPPAIAVVRGADGKWAVMADALGDLVRAEMSHGPALRWNEERAWPGRVFEEWCRDANANWIDPDSV